MKDDDRRLMPPIAMLASFAKAAEHDSFSRAADALALTQGAVSRQVAALEQWLGQPLFERRGRRVALNADGRAYAAAIAPALAEIRRATRRAMDDDGRRALEIATLPSFGMRWLAPRLPGLTARHPDIVVNLTARSDEFDLDAEGFDAAIHFGRPDWPDAAHDFLFRETAIPVVGRQLAGRIATPADLLGVPLLTLRSRADAWAVWFEGQGVDGPGVTISAAHSQFLLLAQTVVAGGGAALIPRFLVEPELAAGDLVAPFAASVASESAYYLVTPRRHSPGPALSAFRGWLLDEVQSAAASPSALRSGPSHAA